MYKKLFLALTLISTSIHADEDLNKLALNPLESKETQDLADKAKLLSLNEAIDEGLRKNFGEQSRKYEFELNELQFKDSHEEFYYPKLTMSLNTNGDHFVENLYRDSRNNGSSPVTPNGQFGVQIEDYKLFNWGRDYLDYMNAKNSYNRKKEQLKENRRSLKFQLITQYFKLSMQYQVVNAHKKQLNHTSFIYRLAKQKLDLKKIRIQEFLQAKAEFLKSHQNYHNSLYVYYTDQRELATLMGDKLEQTYKPFNRLKFKPVTISIKETYRHSFKRNPQLLDAKSLYANASRSYQKAQKDNLPLPTFSVKLGGYKRDFSSAGASDKYETLAGSNNIEIAATLNMKWTLFGSDGFLNSRKLERSYYQKRLADIKLNEAKREVSSSNRSSHSQIKYLEKRFKANQMQLKNVRLLFDKALDNYIDSKTSFTNLKLILDDILAITIDIENTKYIHLIEKISLASMMGVDDFPGEKFESLVLK